MDTSGPCRPWRSPADLRWFLERCWREARLDYEAAGARVKQRASELVFGKVVRVSV